MPVEPKNYDHAATITDRCIAAEHCNAGPLVYFDYNEIVVLGS